MRPVAVVPVDTVHRMGEGAVVQAGRFPGKRRETTERRLVAPIQTHIGLFVVRMRRGRVVRVQRVPVRTGFPSGAGEVARDDHGDLGTVAVGAGLLEGEGAQTAEGVVVAAGTVVTVVDAADGGEGQAIRGLEDLGMMTGAPRTATREDGGVGAGATDMEVTEAPAGKTVTVGETITHTADLFLVRDRRGGFPAAAGLGGVTEDDVTESGVEGALTVGAVFQTHAPPGVERSTLGAAAFGGDIDANIGSGVQGFLPGHTEGPTGVGVEPHQGAVGIGFGEGAIRGRKVRGTFIDAVFADTEEQAIRIVADQLRVAVHHVAALKAEPDRRSALLEDRKQVRGGDAGVAVDVLDPVDGHLLGERRLASQSEGQGRSHGQTSGDDVVVCHGAVNCNSAVSC